MMNILFLMMMNLSVLKEIATDLFPAAELRSYISVDADES